MSEALCEAIAVVARYDSLKDSNGLTRREFNDEFGVESPDPEVPEDFDHLWEWFWDIRRCQPAGMSGATPINHQEYAAWAAMTGNQITREELAALKAMDARYCSGVDAESDDIQARERAA